MEREKRSPAGYKIPIIRKNTSDSETQSLVDDDDDDVIIEDYNTPGNHSPDENIFCLVTSPCENPDELCDRLRVHYSKNNKM